MKPDRSPRPQNMARRLRSGFLLIGLAAMLLTALCVSLLFYVAVGERVEAMLADTAREAAAAYGGRVEDIARMLPAGALRLTLVEADGRVLYDSVAADTAALPNHAARPEVAAALANGSGHTVRYSATQGVETHYYALRLADGRVLRLAQDTGTVWASYARLLPLLALGCVLIGAMAAALAWWETRRLIRPINAMAAHLDDLDDNVPYEELLPLAEGLRSDRKLREDTETMRREFTANVSHELKTPLTSISGYAELIETGMVQPRDIPTFGRRIHREAQRMIALVSDILQLSELDSLSGGRERTPELAPLDLAPLLHETVTAMTLNARRAYVTLQERTAPAPVTGSHDLLLELLTNLCDNAIRYNRPGGHVLLRCGPEPGGGAFLSVEDNGIGIPPEAQSRVFERFYRVDKSRSKATGGTGLGLAIVKHIALLHGARIELTSTPGQGTVIRVLFPRGAAHGA